MQKITTNGQTSNVIKLSEVVAGLKIRVPLDLNGFAYLALAEL